LSQLSFRGFLKEVRFAYIVGTSLLIFLFLVGLFEIISLTFLQQGDPELIRYLHLTRGAVTVTVLLGWIAWTLYEFRDRFLTVVMEHDTQYQRILEMSADAVLITDANHIVTYINPSALELLHRTREDTLHTDASAFIPFGTPNPAAEKTELEWVHGAYRNQILNGTVTVLRNASGEVESHLIVIRDLTERAMRQAQMERSERLASLGHMAAGVAHEIGNPLTAISSMVQLIQRKVTDSAQKEQLAQIRTNIGRITQIVRDLVDFSRPKPAEVAPVYAHVLVNEVIGLLRHDARCRNILFDISGVTPVPVVDAVPDKLFQVLVNLILNAVDATHGHPSPEVRILVRQVAFSIEICVCDNGKGIPQELQTRIFEPFFTTKEVGKGTGLGLSVSHHIIEQFGGELSVSSVPGQTEFRISLPLPQ
jgi:signal transduction histidine kinase